MFEQKIFQKTPALGALENVEEPAAAHVRASLIELARVAGRLHDRLEAVERVLTALASPLEAVERALTAIAPPLEAAKTKPGGGVNP